MNFTSPDWRQVLSLKAAIDDRRTKGFHYQLLMFPCALSSLLIIMLRPMWRDLICALNNSYIVCFYSSIIGSLTGLQVTAAFVTALIAGWVAVVMSRKIYDRRWHVKGKLLWMILWICCTLLLLMEREQTMMCFFVVSIHFYYDATVFDQIQILFEYLRSISEIC
jgi:hypothetical protein